MIPRCHKTINCIFCDIKHYPRNIILKYISAKLKMLSSCIVFRKAFIARLSHFSEGKNNSTNQFARPIYTFNIAETLNFVLSDVTASIDFPSYTSEHVPLKESQPPLRSRTCNLLCFLFNIKRQGVVKPPEFSFK